MSEIALDADTIQITTEVVTIKVRGALIDKRAVLVEERDNYTTEYNAKIAVIDRQLGVLNAERDRG